MRLSASPVLSLACLAALSACTATAPLPPVAASAAPTADTPSNADLLARGNYLVRIAGCNDCHTAGYAERQGEVPIAQWLQGSPLGYRGPWGTTYATKLRLRLADMDESQWLGYSATLRMRPPMPDFALRAMTEDDRRAIYRFIRSLGPAGTLAPAGLAPAATPAPPYFDLVARPTPGA